MIDEGAPWLESMRNARTKVATPVSRTVRSASGENGLLGFNLLPDSEPAPGFGRIGEYRLQLIEYWRRTQRADGTRPEAPAAVPAAAQKPAQPVEPPTVADGTPTRGTTDSRQKPAGPIQLPSSSLIRNGAAPATAPGSLLKTDAPAARISSEPAAAPRQKHPNSLIESINEQMRAVARDVPLDPAGEADQAPLAPVRDLLLDPIAPIAAKEPLRSVTAAEEKPPAAAPAPAPLATEPTVAAVTQVEPVPAAEPEAAAAEAPGKSGWTSAFRSAASSLPSMFASLTSKRQTTGLNLKEAMAGPPAPEARLESAAAEPIATEPVAEQPPEAAEVPDELPMEVAFEVPAMEEPSQLSVDEPEFLPTVDFLAEVSAPSIEPGSIGAYEVDPLQDDLIARLQEEAIDFSAPAQVTSSGDPGLSIPGDFEISVEAPALPADWETPASASGPGALRGLSESLDMDAMASIGADAQFVDPDRVDTAGFDSEARSDAALEAIDASADGLSAAFSDESADSSVDFDMPGIAWEAVSDTAFSIGDVLADEAADVTAATEAEVAPPLMPAKEPAVLHMPAPPPAPTPAPAAPAVALASSPAHVVNRESVSVRALEGFLKRIETRRRQVDKESVA